MSLPVIAPHGENPVDITTRASMEALDFVAKFKDQGAATFVNRTTLLTYYNMAIGHSKAVMGLLPPTLLMILVPEK